MNTLGFCGLVRISEYLHRVCGRYAMSIKRKKWFASALLLIALVFSTSTDALSKEERMIWAIFKISYDPISNKAEGGISGTAFFVTKQDFISANHCFNDSTFMPNKGYSKVKVILVNQEGQVIEDIRIKKIIPEYDLSIGELMHGDKNAMEYSVGHDFSVGDSVYNIGFSADESLVDYRIKIENDKLIVENITVKVVEQHGKAEGVIIVTVNANDVKLQDREMIKLSYSSRVGFSGGPLVLKSTGKIIGMMSLVVPEETDHKRPAMAIRMSDISQFWKVK